MPTFGRLMGAICFAALGAYLATITTPLFEEGTVPSFWMPLCVAAGLWSGWVVVGKRAGHGVSSGVGNGITGVVAQVFWIIALYSLYEMIVRSMRKTYDGPLEAIVGIFELAWEHAQELGTVDVIVSALVGGIIAGLITEFFSSRFS